MRFGTLGAFVRRDWAIALSRRLPFALELGGVLFQVALFYYLSRLIDPRASNSAPELRNGYFGFVLLGLFLLTIVGVGLRSSATRLREEQLTDTLEVLMVTPARPSLIVLSSAVFDLLRATIFGLLAIALGLAVFGLELDTDPVSLLLGVVGLLAAVALFLALGVLVAAYVVLYKQGTALLGLLVAGIAFLGGVYFPTAVLPGPLEFIGKIIPFTWAVNFLRQALVLGDVSYGRLGALIGAAAVALPLALLVFSAALLRARRLGTLGHH